MKTLMITLFLIILIQIPARSDFNSVKEGFRSSDRQALIKSGASSEEIEQFDTKNKLDDMQEQLDRIEKNQNR